MDEKKTLKYFSDNKNFAKIPQKKHKTGERVLRVVGDRIVMQTETPEHPEDEIVTSYTYMKNKGSKMRWSKQETEFFYRALECCGLDFSMMNLLFPDRTRGNLKVKYKRESKMNPNHIDEIVSAFRGVNLKKFERLRVEIRRAKRVR